MGLRMFSHRPAARGTRTGSPFERLPDLATYDDEPLYDQTTVADLLGVRRMTLWAWEQQLRIPAHPQRDAAPGQPRFSERDLVALVWLRDQILGGASPYEAAARLIPGLEASRSGALSSPQGAGAIAVPLFPPTSTPGMLAPDSASPASTSHVTSAAAGATSFPMAAPMTPPAWLAQLARPDYDTGSTIHLDLPSAIAGLLQAFAALDAGSASAIVERALGSYPIEDVCTGILLPALARVESLSGRREVALAETLFARNYARSLLFAHFVSAIERQDYPVVFLGCAPKEEDEIPALLLGLFWRRLGLRVVYFGPDVDASTLVQQFESHRPALLALTASQPQRIRALGRVAREVGEAPGDPVLFGYYGRVFAQNRELRARVAGQYLGDDPTAATRLVRQHLLAPHGLLAR